MGLEVSKQQGGLATVKTVSQKVSCVVTTQLSVYFDKGKFLKKYCKGVEKIVK